VVSWTHCFWSYGEAAYYDEEHIVENLLISWWLKSKDRKMVGWDSKILFKGILPIT
jgi:hypothetical protein